MFVLFPVFVYCITIQPMKKLVGMLLIAAASLVGGIKLGQDPPPALTRLGASLGVEISDPAAAQPQAQAQAQAEAEAEAEAGDEALIPLTDLSLLPGDPPGTVYTLSVNETMIRSSLDADIEKLTAALYESVVLETVDAHANKWFVLTVGEYASREDAQNAGAVLYGSLGLTGVTKKLPPPAEAAP
jgi:hypothetical protein